MEKVTRGREAAVERQKQLEDVRNEEYTNHVNSILSKQKEQVKRTKGTL